MTALSFSDREDELLLDVDVVVSRSPSDQASCRFATDSLSLLRPLLPPLLSLERRRPLQQQLSDAADERLPSSSSEAPRALSGLSRPLSGRWRRRRCWHQMGLSTGERDEEGALLFPSSSFDPKDARYPRKRKRKTENALASEDGAENSASSFLYHTKKGPLSRAPSYGFRRSREFFSFFRYLLSVDHFLLQCRCQRCLRSRIRMYPSAYLKPLSLADSLQWSVAFISLPLTGDV